MSKRPAQTDRDPKRFHSECPNKPGNSKGDSEKIATFQIKNSEQTKNSGKIENSERIERPKPLTSYKELDSSKVAIIDPYVAKEPSVLAHNYYMYQNRTYRNWVRIISQSSQSNSDSDDDLYDGMWI